MAVLLPIMPMVSSLSRSDVNGDTWMDFFVVNVRHTVTMNLLIYLQIPECICPLSSCRNIHRRRGGPLVPHPLGSCRSRSQTYLSWWWRWFRGHWNPSLEARSPPPTAHSPWSVTQGDRLSQTCFFSITVNSFHTFIHCQTSVVLYFYDKFLNKKFSYQITC